MKRITVPDESIEGGTRKAVVDSRAVREIAMELYWRLKDYEDTGLTPEEARKYQTLENRMEQIYGDHEGLLEIIVEQLEKHEGIDIPPKVYKTRLLTDDDADRWEAYQDTGLTPEQIREMDQLYTEKCKELEKLRTKTG